MNWIIDDKVALRGWRGLPYMAIFMDEKEPVPLTEEQFELLLDCDGSGDISDGKTCRELADKGIIRPSLDEDEGLRPWQKYRWFDNEYMPNMVWEITTRCNYECIHCFNSSTQQEKPKEFSLEEGLALIEQAESCGIRRITITGGEPLLHPNIGDFFEAIYEKNMLVAELNTNGAFITEDFLSFLKSIGASPLVKISFDGLGFHDRIRGAIGAEELALSAIKLCVENGFSVMVQYNINRLNLDTFLPTLEMLDAMGVKRTRIIRTSESPKLLQTDPDIPLSINEYYDSVLAVLSEYCASDRAMDISAWQFVQLDVSRKAFCIDSLLHYYENGYRGNRTICSTARQTISIGTNGNVYPCMQCSGFMDMHNMNMGNVFETELKALLQESEFLRVLNTTVQERINHNEKCRTCPYVRICCCGCPTLGLMYSGDKCDFLSHDEWKCILFNERYDKKCEDMLKGYTNLARMPVLKS